MFASYVLIRIKSIMSPLYMYEFKSVINDGSIFIQKKKTQINCLYGH